MAQDYSKPLHIEIDDEDVQDVGAECPACDGTGYNQATLELYRTFHSSWCHELSDNEVEILWEAKRLWGFESRPTAREVNRWSYQGFGYDVISRDLCTQVRALNLTVYGLCGRCGGAKQILH